MTIGETLKSNFPKSINKDGEIFKAMVANNNQNAAMESILNDVEKFTKEYYGTPDIYEQSGELLDKTVTFYTYLEQFVDETEEALKKRIAAIFVRNGDSVWGTPNNILNVFKQYFPSANIFLVENVNGQLDEGTIKGNLFPNGDVQEEGNWVFSDPSVLSQEARFSKTYGLKLTENTWAKQTMDIPNEDYATYETVEGDTYESIAQMEYGNSELGNYIKNYKNNPAELTVGTVLDIPSRNVFFLHFFVNGNVKVSIKNNLNKYWDNSTLSWSDTLKQTSFSTNKWQDVYLYFLVIKILIL